MLKRSVCPCASARSIWAASVLAEVEAIIGPDKTFRGTRFSDDELHIVCPWHGWEFNVETGRCAGDGKHGLHKYKVVERDDEIYVVI